VGVLSFESSEAREYAAAVVSTLARTQGGNKRAIVQAGGIGPLIELLSDASIQTQRHAACALWGLAEGKEGVYDKEIVEAGAVHPLIQMLLLNHAETRGFAAACLSCCCADDKARLAIVEHGGAEPLVSLAHSPTAWLRSQAKEMLRVLGIPFHDPDRIDSPRVVATSPPPEDAGGVQRERPFLIGSKLIANKTLPIRLHKSVNPEKQNDVVGVLNQGDAAFVVERLEVAPGVVRARVALEVGAQPVGWVTMAREGVTFMVSEPPLVAPVVGSPLLSPSQRGRAEMAAMQHSPRNANESLRNRLKFHFFSFRVSCLRTERKQLSNAFVSRVMRCGCDAAASQKSTGRRVILAMLDQCVLAHTTLELYTRRVRACIPTKARTHRHGE
jgi:hypothetical protein